MKMRFYKSTDRRRQRWRVAYHQSRSIRANLRTMETSPTTCSLSQIAYF